MLARALGARAEPAILDAAAGQRVGKRGKIFLRQGLVHIFRFVAVFIIHGVEVGIKRGEAEPGMAARADKRFVWRERNGKGDACGFKLGFRFAMGGKCGSKFRAEHAVKPHELLPAGKRDGNMSCGQRCVFSAYVGIGLCKRSAGSGFDGILHGEERVALSHKLRDILHLGQRECVGVNAKCLVEHRFHAGGKGRIIRLRNRRRFGDAGRIGRRCGRGCCHRCGNGGAAGAQQRCAEDNQQRMPCGLDELRVHIQSEDSSSL